MSIQQILLAGGAPVTEFGIYKARIAALGASLTSTEDTYATNLINAIQAASYGSKIKYLLPFLGTSIDAARVPLRDSLNVGAADLTGPLGSRFTNSNCRTAVGITNPTEQSCALATNIKPSQLGTSNNGGIGFYERNWGAGTGVEPAGCYGNTNSPDERYCLDLRSSMQRFRWGGASTSQAGPATTAGSGHYYGQRSSATLRRIYKDGTTLGSDGTANEPANRANELSMLAVGCQESNGTGPFFAYWNGRCAVFYFTDGTFSDADVAAFHTLLGTYLITPTGR